MTSLLIVFLTLPAFSANVGQADFAAGYWDQEYAGYGARALTAYTLSVAVDDPAKARTAVEAALGGAGGKLTNFSDQSQAYAGMEHAAMAMRARPVYTLTYQFTTGKAATVARKLISTGRLLSYNVQAPYQASQRKDIEERIAWIEKEKAGSAEALAKMPVSRAMLEGKLKRLKAALEAAKGSEGLESVSVSIMREDPGGGPKPPAAQP